ncbi:MAG: endonuclease III domain-containing protein [Planctomycetota bacterium]|nr:endonuclease III domain-containing protein [Planctomycetota bacterium]
MRTGEKIRAFYDTMLAAYGPQHWWPAETPFEVVIGAILTQNTNWKNVEQAIANLKREGLLRPDALAKIPTEQLAEVIRPAGYYRIKANRLKNFIEMLVRDFGGDLEALFALRISALREAVLGVSGIGPETADSIVLYAAAKPVFVVDTYTARILHRHGLIDLDATYEDIQSLMQDNLVEDVATFQEYHALLVEVGKRQCKKAAPICAGCPLQRFLEAGQPATY